MAAPDCCGRGRWRASGLELSWLVVNGQSLSNRIQGPERVSIRVGHTAAFVGALCARAGTWCLVLGTLDPHPQPQETVCTRSHEDNHRVVRVGRGDATTTTEERCKLGGPASTNSIHKPCPDVRTQRETEDRARSVLRRGTGTRSPLAGQQAEDNSYSILGILRLIPSIPRLVPSRLGSIPGILGFIPSAEGIRFPSDHKWLAVQEQRVPVASTQPMH